jgi:uncharacterized protein (TIGR02246 family)
MASIREVVDEAGRIYSKGDAEGLTELFSDDAVIIVPGARYEGKEQIRDYWASLMRGTPNGTSVIRRSSETDDTLFAEVTVRGTNTGELSLPDGTTVAATGRAVEIPAMELVVVRGGTIVEQSVYYDVLGMLQQLGLMPG